jgi:PRTRC genetic system protein B
MNRPMNGFSLTTGETNIALSQAILVYTDDNRRSHSGSAMEAVYASVHPVQNFGTDAKPDFQIAAGRPVSREALLLMFKELAKQHSLNTDIIPENVLSISADHMVWWLPAGERNVFFNNKELGQRAAKVPHPALMFAVVKGQWYIFALEKNERPTAETALQFAPYFNVYDSCAICTGSAQVPRGISANATAQWEKAFFESEFTHINGSKKKSSHPRGEYAMWKELLDGVYPTFPVEFLVPTGSTLATLMVGVRKSLGAQ